MCRFKTISSLLLIVNLIFFPIFISYLYFLVTFDWESEILKDGGHFVKLRDGRYLEYFELGDPENDVVVFIPGASSTGWGISEGFKISHPKLFENHYWLIPSLPGYGGSSLAKDRRLEDFPLDVEDWLTQMGLQEREILFIGCSLGSTHVYSIGCVDSSLKIKKLILSSPLFPEYFDEESNPGIPSSYDALLQNKLLFDLSGIVFHYAPSLVMNEKAHEGRMNDCLNFPQEILSISQKDHRRVGKFDLSGFFYNFVLWMKPTSDALKKCPTKRLKLLKEQNKIMITYGAKDKVCPFGNVQEYLKSFEMEEKELIRYEDGHCGCIRNIEDYFFKAILMDKNK